MIGLIGKKIGMSQIFDNKGKVIPVTLVETSPCCVIQKKTIEKDGYVAIQLGFNEIPEKKLKKPQLGHFKKKNLKTYKHLHEFKIDDEKYELGDTIDIDIFKANEKIKVVSISKGKGFAGVMKRHNFSGFEQTHGVHESFRGSGSIGQCAQPSRVLKGLKMAGHLGHQKTTVKNLLIVKIDKDKNLIMIKGAIPGHNNSIVYLTK
jgi:large subunit ribosomal protein L3